MNWISGIQTSIDYIEAHLTDEMDYEENRPAQQRPQIFRHSERVEDPNYTCEIWIAVNEK